MSGPWLVALGKAASPAFELVCMPWAGGGVSGFGAIGHAISPVCGCIHQVGPQFDSILSLFR